MEVSKVLDFQRHLSFDGNPTRLVFVVLPQEDKHGADVGEDELTLTGTVFFSLMQQSQPKLIVFKRFTHRVISGVL